MRFVRRGLDRVRRDPTWAGAIAVLLVVAVLLRLPDLDSGPGYLNQDERIYVPKAFKYVRGDLNPHWFDNPPLMSYLMTLGQLVHFGLGRALGFYAGPLEFKARFVADGSAAFLAARVVVLVLATASVWQIGAWCRRTTSLLGGDARAARAAGIVAAAVLATSPLHVQRGAMATNDVLLCLCANVTGALAVEFVVDPTRRRLLLTAAAAGVSMGSKWTGVMTTILVAAAVICAPGLSWTRRAQYAAMATAAWLAAFLVTCPWPVLDWAGFYPSARWQAFEALYRGTRDRWFYAESLWRAGLGPALSIAVLVGLTAAAIRCLRGSDVRPRILRTLVLFAAGAGLLLTARLDSAADRHVLVILGTMIVAAVASLWTLPGRLGILLRAGVVAAATFWTFVQIADAAARTEDARRPRTEDEAMAWMRANLPDGAWVLTDRYHPWMPSHESVSAYRDGLPERTRSLLYPAFRQHRSTARMGGELTPVDGKTLMPDDWKGLRASGPAYVLLADATEHLFDTAPEGRYPERDWVRRVRRELPLLRTLGSPHARGPVFRLYEVRPD